MLFAKTLIDIAFKVNGFNFIPFLEDRAALNSFVMASVRFVHIFLLHTYECATMLRVVRTTSLIILSANRP